MSQFNRRQFFSQVAMGTTALAFAKFAVAQEVASLTEDDGYARAMGFRLIAENADHPKYQAGQNCSTCQLYSGAEGADLGPCSFFGGRLVPPTGWCRNYKPHGEG